MTRSEVLRLLAEHRDELANMGAKSLSLFGSVARDEAGPESDVDLLVDIRRPMGFFEYCRIKPYLGSCSVDRSIWSPSKHSSASFAIRS